LFTFLAVALLIAEVVIRAFPLLKRIGARNHAAYLASRRILSAPTLVIVLIAGAALPVATLVYAASLTRSATSTIDAKGRGFVGADISTPVFALISPPGDIADVSTVVIRSDRADLEGTTVDVLAVDGVTFPNGAFWDESLAGIPLEEILDTLAGDAVGGPLAAYVATGTATDGVLNTEAGDVEVVVVGEVEAFPGGRGSRPLVIVDRQRFVEVVADEDGRVSGSRYLMWTNDRTEAEVEAAMAEAGINYAFTVNAATTLDQLKFAAVVWTFDFLEIYATLAGLIAIGGVLLYVDTRQRQRNLSYARARRMGLRRSEHLQAGLMEIASLTVLGAVAGIFAARVAAGSLYRALDAVPETPPGPRWIGAIDLSLLALVIALAVAAIAAILSQRTADSADTSELLRHGD
jgi:putative ABC transport system permease protein